jgi:RNA polymerase sigma-70 factor (ECF subfamily)
MTNKQNKDSIKLTEATGTIPGSSFQSVEDCLLEEYESLRDRLISLSMKYQKTLAEAEEVVSDTMIQVLEKKEQFQGNARFSTWVFSICIRRNLEVLRRKKTYAEKLKSGLTDQWLKMVGRYDGFEPLKADFRAALEKLSEQERNVFILTVYEEFSQKEIAETLDMSLSNVKVTLHRGRKRLMELLKSYL